MPFSNHNYARRATKDSSDYKYDFILNLDDFPFFAMYVNMKKAIYEQCLLAAQENGELNEKALDALEEGELLSEKGELLFKSLKELTYKKGELTYEPDSILNYDKFEDYLDRLEKPLLYIKPYSGAIINIFDRLNANIPNIILEQSGGCVHTEIFSRDEEDEEEYLDEDELYDLKWENDWSYYEYDFSKVCPYADEMARAYLEAKAIVYSKQDPIVHPKTKKEEYGVKLDRSTLLEVTNQKQYERICRVFDIVVSTLTDPEYALADTLIISILDQALAGMRRVVFARQLDQYAYGKEKIFSREQLRKALNVGTEKFSLLTDVYGERTFTENEIKVALEAMGQPSNLFDI